jgi:hypothetical protein
MVTAREIAVLRCVRCANPFSDPQQLAGLAGRCLCETVSAFERHNSFHVTASRGRTQMGYRTMFRAAQHACRMPPAADALRYTGGAPELWRAAANNVTADQDDANSKRRVVHRDRPEAVHLRQRPRLEAHRVRTRAIDRLPGSVTRRVKNIASSGSLAMIPAMHCSGPRSRKSSVRPARPSFREGMLQPLTRFPSPPAIAFRRSVRPSITARASPRFVDSSTLSTS